METWQSWSTFRGNFRSNWVRQRSHRRKVEQKLQNDNMTEGVELENLHGPQKRAVAQQTATWLEQTSSTTSTPSFNGLLLLLQPFQLSAPPHTLHQMVMPVLFSPPPPPSAADVPPLTGCHHTQCKSPSSTTTTFTADEVWGEWRILSQQGSLAGQGVSKNAQDLCYRTGGAPLTPF